jgi:hypothetical protein
MSVIIYNGWIVRRQYNDTKPFAWTAYCENDPEWTADGRTLDEVKQEIDEKIENRQLKTA